MVVTSRHLRWPLEFPPTEPGLQLILVEFLRLLGPRLEGRLLTLWTHAAMLTETMINLLKRSPEAASVR